MTKSSVVSLNRSLEKIEEQSANIRLALMQRDIEMVCDDYWEVEIIDDCIAICNVAVDLPFNPKYRFGILAGYFDECWWSGIVLFKADDSSANTSDKLKEVIGIFENNENIKVSISSEHYVYVDSVGIVECEEFSEFMPKLLESFKANKKLICKLSSVVSDVK